MKVIYQFRNDYWGRPMWYKSWSKQTDFTFAFIGIETEKGMHKLYTGRKGKNKKLAGKVIFL